ncbi:hypothetical protein pipiens_014793 [Culex pipiens pipiens]|uniref:Zinc finger protein n=1 Tax=Culex pipiens pipiens TaxID=38569 RepID=A0ABD1CT22_CULPP
MAGCGKKCCVSGCDSRKDASGYSFHTFPVASELRIANCRRKLWHDAVFGKDSARIALKNTKICGKHFVTGKPAKLTETSEVNWIPTLHLGPGRVAPQVKTSGGLPLVEDGVLPPEQVNVKEQKVVRLAESNDTNPFQEEFVVKVEVLDVEVANSSNEADPIPEEVVVKEEVLDVEVIKAMPEQVVPKKQRVLRVEKSNAVEPVDKVAQEIKEEILNEEEEIQSILKTQTCQISFNRCMFCLNELPPKEQILPDFNKESTFRTQVEYVLAKTIEAPNYPCCSSCKQMFHLFYKFKKSCLVALAKPLDLIKSQSAKRPANHPISPAPKRKSEVVTIHPKIDEQGPIEPNDVEDDPEESPSSDGYKEERMRCKNCGTMYDEGFVLANHKLKCLPPKDPPRCTLCPAVFKNKWDLQVHLNRHNGLTPFQCRKEGCTKAFAGPIVRIIHEKNCQKESNKVVCPSCGMAFKCELYLQRHMITHEAPKYECAVCHRKFGDLTTFRAHMMRHFERNETPAEEQPHEDVPSDFRCDSCEQEFATPELLNGHKVYCGKNKKFRKFQLLCPLCPESFHKQETLDQHLSRHKGIKSIPCRKEGCDKMFFDTAGRNVHELYRCGRGGTHVCSICQAAFGTATSLRVHMKGHRKPTAVKD